jgi:hypothetical protein
MLSDTVFRAGFYYVGSFDDEILRYNGTDLDLSLINATLSQAAIAGGPLLINDGYLMHYPDGRKALTDRSASPLLDLIDVGFVQIFSRTGGNLAEMPERMQHIPSYQALLKDPTWERMKNNLRDAQHYWGTRGVLVNWPKVDVGPGFQRLINIAFANLGRMGLPPFIDGSQAVKLLEVFNGTLNSDRKLAARATWMKTVTDPELGFSQEAREYLHWVGIEAYHYNMGMIASLAMNGTAGLITRFSTLFTGIHMTLAEEENGASAFELPRPQVPRGLESRITKDGKFLAELVRPGELNSKKNEYLAALKFAIEDWHYLPDAVATADEYGRAISKALIESDPERDDLIQIVGVLASGAGSILGAAMGKSPLEVGMLGVAFGFAANVIKPFLHELTFDIRPRVDLAIDIIKPLESRIPRSPTLQNPRGPSKWFAFMPVNPDAVVEHVSVLPALA